MTNTETDRIQNAIRHIQTAVDVDPWAIKIAVEALEKQIPKVPVMDYGFGEKIRQVMIRKGDKEKAEYKTDCCPVCKRPLGISKFVRSKTGMRFGDLYCKHCGQAILWE